MIFFNGSLFVRNNSPEARSVGLNPSLIDNLSRSSLASSSDKAKADQVKGPRFANRQAGIFVRAGAIPSPHLSFPALRLLVHKLVGLHAVIGVISVAWLSFPNAIFLLSSFALCSGKYLVEKALSPEV